MLTNVWARVLLLCGLHMLYVFQGFVAAAICCSCCCQMPLIVLRCLRLLCCWVQWLDGRSVLLLLLLLTYVKLAAATVVVVAVRYPEDNALLVIVMPLGAQRTW